MSPPPHRVRRVGLDGRAALGAAVEREVDPRLGLGKEGRAFQIWLGFRRRKELQLRYRKSLIRGGHPSY